MLKRLETNYDLDQKAIKLDTKRLVDLEKLDPNSIIGEEQFLKLLNVLIKKSKILEMTIKERRMLKLLEIF